MRCRSRSIEATGTRRIARIGAAPSARSPCTHPARLIIRRSTSAQAEDVGAAVAPVPLAAGLLGTCVSGSVGEPCSPAEVFVL